MENSENTKNNYFIIAGIWSVIWSIVVYCIVDEIGVGYTLLNIPISFVAYLLGDAFRRFTAPTAIFTSQGATDIFFKKLFWLIGPQIVSMIIGSVALYSLMYE